MSIDVVRTYSYLRIFLINFTIPLFNLSDGLYTTQ